MDIEKSLIFYEQLGFVTVDTDDGKPLGWARMHCDGGALMFLRAEHAVNPAVQGVMLYMYAADLTALRDQLQKAGIAMPPISYPGYMPSWEMQLMDPDGYYVIVAHWSNKEQETWDKRIKERLPRAEPAT